MKVLQLLENDEVRDRLQSTTVAILYSVKAGGPPSTNIEEGVVSSYNEARPPTKRQQL